MRLPAFETIIKPHRDVQRGLSTADTYAAKLGQVAKNEGPPEYRKADQFFEKTYVTNGLKALLSGIEGRLNGKDRRHQDPIVQLQTPFGGGKTHTLIALYHKAKEWDATPIVLVGSGMDATDTFWGQIAAQLTGSVTDFNTLIAPGSDSLSELLDRSEKPVMILMDEVLNYLDRAKGVSVHDSTLASQTLSFMLSLTEAVASSRNTVLIVTLQESEIEGFANDYPLFNGLLARMHRMVTPVEDTEIASIIRSRLFAKDNFNQGEAKQVVREFTKYAKQEDILPPGVEASEYRDRFFESYPFQPEVIDVLYRRWGSYPNFQRTRGVLRLLSRVVHGAYRKNRPYITLGDFDLNDPNIREEFLSHIDDHYRSVIHNDITGQGTGANVVNNSLGDTYKNQALGTRTATTIFLCSFTGGKAQRGTQLDEIKRSTAIIESPSAIIDTTMNQLREHLFYLRTENGTSYFDTEANLNSIVRTRTENIDDEKVSARVQSELQQGFRTASGAKFKVTLTPKESSDIRDTDDLKLIVLSERDDDFCRDLIAHHGENPRVNRNTLFFIVPIPGQTDPLRDAVKNVLAYEEIREDKSLNLSEKQLAEIHDTLRQAPNELRTALRQDYRTVLIPKKDGFEEADLGVPAAGMSATFDESVYELLKIKRALQESIGAQNISLRYLKDNDTLSTAQLHNSSLRTPGENRVLREAWVNGIRQGVQNGVFALGKRTGDTLLPLAFKNAPLAVTLESDEVLIHPRLIRENITPEDILRDYLKDNASVSTTHPFRYTGQSEDDTQVPVREAWISAIQDGVRNGIFGLGNKTEGALVPSAFRQEPPPITLADDEVILQADLCTKLVVDPPTSDPDPSDRRTGSDPMPPEEQRLQNRETIDIRFTLPSGKVSNVAQHINELHSYFDTIQIALKANDGQISVDAYETLKENLRTLGIEVKEG